MAKSSTRAVQYRLTDYGVHIALALLLALSAALFYWVATGGFGPCSPTLQSLEKYSKTFAALDGIIDVGLKLSTTLAGLGAALLIGLKSEIVLTKPIRSIILVATLFFAQSAFYAVWWRLGLAEIWLNECLDLVTAARYQNRFLAHFAFFFFGLLSFGTVAIGAAMFPIKAK